MAHAKTRLQKYVDKGQVTFIKSNFRNIKEELAEHGVFHVDGILYDLGVSSPQLDEAERGFSYHQDAPLDMRMDQDAPLTAREVVNTYSYSELVKFSFVMGKRNFRNRLLEKLNVFVKSSQLKQQVNLLRLLRRRFQLQQDAKVDILQNEFSKQFALPLMMN